MTLFKTLIKRYSIWISLLVCTQYFEIQIV